MEAALDAVRLLRRHARAAEAAAHRRPHLARCCAAGGRTATGSTDEEIIAFLFLMVVAGNETTTKLLGNALFHLTAHPDQRRRGLRRRRGLVGRWIEETLRFDTSSQMLARHLVGRRRPCTAWSRRPGSKLLLVLGVGQPRRAGLHRPGRLRRPPRPRPSSRQILSFGGGRHFCLGANLARLEAQDRAARSWYARARTVEVDRDRGRPGALDQRARLRRAAGRGGGALMSKYAQPDASARRRHRRLVRHRCRHRARPRRGRASRSRSAPAAPTSARRSPTQIREAGGEAVAHPLDVTDDQSVADVRRRRSTADARRHRGASSPTPAPSRPGVIHEVDTERLRRRARRQPARRPPAGAGVRAGHGRAAARRRASSCPPTSRCGRGRSWRRTPRASGGSKGMAHAMQMELEGTGVRASHRAPGPDVERDGHRLGRPGRGRRAQPVGAVRAGPAPALPQAAGDRRRDRHRRRPRRAACT